MLEHLASPTDLFYITTLQTVAATEVSSDEVELRLIKGPFPNQLLADVTVGFPNEIAVDLCILQDWAE